MKISGVYKITNTITGDFYIGSSKDVKQRWADHKKPSTWNDNPNNPMYLDMKKYGLEKFVFEVLAEVEPVSLKEKEQQFIEQLNPKYNSNRANTGLGARKGREAEYDREHYQKYKEEKLEQSKQYYESNKQQKKQYYESKKEQIKQKNNQLCSFNGEILTLCALSQRFRKAGIPHPVLEAKKYLLQ